MCRVVASIVLLCWWGGAIMAQNLIRNPDFEEGWEAPSEWIFWKRGRFAGGEAHATGTFWEIYSRLQRTPLL